MPKGYRSKFVYKQFVTVRQLKLIGAVGESEELAIV